MTSSKFDVAIVGGGPGGYVGAIRAAQLGLSVAVIEKEQPGGVCLNWGCIPTKALLKNAELVLTMRHAADYGILCDNLRFDMSKAVERSRKAADTLASGVAFLLKKNKVELISGHGRLSSRSTVEVTDGGGSKRVIEASAIIIATGSRSKAIPVVPVDGTRIITSSEAMLLREPPGSMTIIGGGAIGVEFAYYYAAYGTKVTIVEMLPHILPLEDAEISETLERAFKKLGMVIKTGARLEKAEAGTAGTTVTVTANGQTEAIYGDITLLAIGRDPNTQDMGLETVGVKTERGFITVDREKGYQTSVPGIYAIGDVIGAPLLAHVASAEGIHVAERLAGHHPAPIDYGNIPGCVYCQPQVASVGMTEEEARKHGEIKVFKMPYRASGKAVALGETEGMVKLIADARYGEILGAHIIGAEATEMIAEICTARTLETTATELHKTVHAHPTLSELIMEASAGIDGAAIHI
ncbi:MAG: dihydrolipoyl dehydrogenase [candidate division Zixibacteria bacterium]|nr:dihydrolipoyl dehydrogenase [candidate division Zixibacteria bacterium]